MRAAVLTGFFLLLSKSLELFELIHFGMAKNHDDAFEVFSLSSIENSSQLYNYHHLLHRRHGHR